LERLFGYEQIFSESATIDLVFEDDNRNIYKKEFKEFNYEFLVGIVSNLPLHFKKNGNKIYFKKTELNFTKIFANHEKIVENKIIKSNYNCVYYSYINFEQIDVFSIVKIASPESTTQRFILAYHLDEFSKDEINYIVECIFKDKFYNNV
jgi:hypothetical protein